MGKSTAASMFADLGCAVWDADAAVHRLYAVGGGAVSQMKDAFPDAIVDDAVSRPALKEIISSNPSALKQIERIVHPLVAQDRAEFISQATADIAVFDIPLLFETGGNVAMDATACVFVCDDIQEARVMERGTMTHDQFISIRGKQMPAAEKCKLADYVIPTDTLEEAAREVHNIVKKIRSQLSHA